MPVWLYGEYTNPTTGRQGHALLGPYKDTTDALEDTYRFNGQPQVLDLATHDPARAAQLVKYQRVHHGQQDIGHALERVRHSLPHHDNGSNPAQPSAAWVTE